MRVDVSIVSKPIHVASKTIIPSHKLLIRYSSEQYAATATGSLK
jgi:hypothetical protein